MSEKVAKEKEYSFDFYHKKNIFDLVNFKDIVITFVLTAVFLSVIFLLILIPDGFHFQKIADAFLNPDTQTLSDVYGNAFGGMMVGVMALLMTVVAFVVQMAANRYTTKIVDLFISNKTNIFFMTFASVTTVTVIALLYLGDSSKTMPRISLFVSFVMVSLLLISIFPYFIFIFKFIQPSNIIYKIEKETFMNIVKSYRVSDSNAKMITKLHRNCLSGVNQLTDNAMNCIQNKDQTLAVECIRSLRYLMINYLKLQHNRPLRESWLKPTNSVKMDVSFITFSEESLGLIENSNVWFEDKILKQIEMLFRSSINKDRTICNYIVNSLFVIGCRALTLKNYEILKKIIMYFNTLLRATINEGDLRTCFNALNQYRKLAEKIVESHEDGIVIEIVKHFKYYGLLAKDKGMDFILETAAHDLCDINKKAYSSTLQKRTEILDIFLTVDMPIEGEKEISLRGIRKAQIRLAAYYLNQGTEDATSLARKIYTDILDELHRTDGFVRIYSMIRELKYSKKDFWEINDREYNFNYCPSNEKKHLPEFLSWFVIRLIILYSVEQAVHKDTAKAAGFMRTLQSVAESLPDSPLVDELLFEGILGMDHMDIKGNFNRRISELAHYLGNDDHLLREIKYQEDLDYPELSKNLATIKEGIARFFQEYTPD